MGCFFGCFRARESRSQNQFNANSNRSKSREDLASQNRLSSLFLAEEREDSFSNSKGCHTLVSPWIDQGLKDQAKLLKACGTIPKTPVEMRKSSGKLKNSPPCNDLESPKNQSWHPVTSIQKITLDSTPSKLCEALARESVSSEETPSSCISDVQNTGKISGNSSEGNEQKIPKSYLIGQTTEKDDITTKKDKGRSRTVRFECNFDVSSSIDSSESISHSLKKLEIPGNRSVSKHVPCPTPLKLTDEMQTPGTVFPTNMDSLRKGKNGVRSQFVYEISNPTGNDSLLEMTKEEESYSSLKLQGYGDQEQNKTPKSEVVVKESLTETVEASLSTWLKPQPSAYANDNNQNKGPVSQRIPYFGRTPSDRPIIGTVAAHWNMDESSHISPKWWDGNGIPNSTNKYKEDQKVSWHATPFEERLEKALSEETSFSQKKNMDPMAFDMEEIDTAHSQLPPSTHTKSVVSF